MNIIRKFIEKRRELSRLNCKCERKYQQIPIYGTATDGVTPILIKYRCSNCGRIGNYTEAYRWNPKQYARQNLR